VVSRNGDAYPVEGFRREKGGPFALIGEKKKNLESSQEIVDQKFSVKKGRYD